MRNRTRRTTLVLLLAIAVWGVPHSFTPSAKAQTPRQRWSNAQLPHRPRDPQTPPFITIIGVTPGPIVVDDEISDPVGDHLIVDSKAVVDCIGVRGGTNGNAPGNFTRHIWKFSSKSTADRVGYGFLDTDRDVKTGLRPSEYFGSLAQDKILGADYILDFFWIPVYGEVDIWDTRANLKYLGTIKAKTVKQDIYMDLPNHLFNNSLSMKVGAVWGDLEGPTDWVGEEKPLHILAVDLFFTPGDNPGQIFPGQSFNMGVVEYNPKQIETTGITYSLNGYPQVFYALRLVFGDQAKRGVVIQDLDRFLNHGENELKLIWETGRGSFSKKLSVTLTTDFK